LKTCKHLYPQITHFDNLWLAFKGAARGKRSHWDVSAFEYDLESNLLDLQDELQAQTYRPGPYRNFRIYDPKPRLISAARSRHPRPLSQDGRGESAAEYHTGARPLVVTPLAGQRRG